MIPFAGAIGHPLAVPQDLDSDVGANPQLISLRCLHTPDRAGRIGARDELFPASAIVSIEAGSGADIERLVVNCDIIDCAGEYGSEGETNLAGKLIGRRFLQREQQTFGLRRSQLRIAVGLLKSAGEQIKLLLIEPAVEPRVVQLVEVLDNLVAIFELGRAAPSPPAL